MALANSSLALAADHLTGALQGALTDVLVTVEHPKQAEKTSDGTNDKHFVNIFFYKIEPSQFHAAQTSGERLFLRVSALITPFPKKTIDGNPAEDFAALRILGEVVRYFHENPVSGVANTPTATPQTAYRMECALQAPSMEELNHIWTTQGDLPYRTSAAYEFSLIPVDSSRAAQPAGQITTTIIEVSPDATPPSGPRDLTLDPQSRPAEVYRALEDTGGPPWPGSPLLPNMRALDADGIPQGKVNIAPASNSVKLALSGPAGTRAQVRLKVQKLEKQGSDWVTADLRTSNTLHAIKAGSFEDAAGHITIPVNLAGANRVVAEIRQVDDADAPLAPDRIGSTLTLDVDGGPPGGGP